MANIITDIQLSGITYQIQGEVTVDAALDSGSTNPVANSAITTAIATVSAATTANTTALGGLSLIKLTQAQYDALVTKDNSTLSVIVD